MASKDVRGSDHEGIISFSESVLSHFPINILSTECKKKPYKRCTVCSKQKTRNTLAVWKVWSVPSYPEMFQGIPHKNIILGEYLHSIHCFEILKRKIFTSLFFINIFVWTYIFMQWTDLVGNLNLSAVFTHRLFKSELIGLSCSSVTCCSNVVQYKPQTHTLRQRLQERVALNDFS
jgi:hypothetical protein